MKNESFWLTDKLIGAWQMKQTGPRVGIHRPEDKQLWAFLSYDCPPEGMPNRLEGEIMTFSQRPSARHWALHMLRGPQYQYDNGLQVAVALWVGRAIPSRVLEQVKEALEARAARLFEMQEQYWQMRAEEDVESENDPGYAD